MPFLKIHLTWTFFADKAKVVTTSYYKIVEVGVNGNADSLTNLIIQHFEMDGILDAVRRRLKGVSSDGASVMYGRKVIFNCF